MARKPWARARFNFLRRGTERITPREISVVYAQVFGVNAGAVQFRSLRKNALRESGAFDYLQRIYIPE